MEFDKMQKLSWTKFANWRRRSEMARVGSDIENLLIAISENTRAKPEKLEGARYFFEGCLDSEQRTRVYEVIPRLAENLPSRRSVQWSFVLKQRRDRENAEFNARLRATEENRSTGQ
jgi:hypothetical protein